MPVQPTKIHFLYRFPVAILFLVGSISSCTVVKKYRPYKPFVFENKINIVGKSGIDEKSALKDRLLSQIEDSVKPKVKYFLFLHRKIVGPAVFDSNYVKQSLVNMRNLIITNGYFRGKVSADWSEIDTVEHRGKLDQYRLTVEYTVDPGKNFKIDTVSYAFIDSNLQRLAEQSQKKSELRKNMPYSQDKIDAELDRLIDYFRDNGYYKITRDVLFAQVDTVNITLIDPTADPFEQIRLQVEAQKKLQNPTINIAIRQKPSRDSSGTQPFHIGSVSILPEESPDQIFNIESFQKIVYNNYSIYYRYHLFDPAFLVNRVTLKPGNLYRLEDYNKTLTNFNRIEAWQSVNILSRQKDTTDPTVDFYIRMVPARKYFFSVDFEGSSFLNYGQNLLYYTGNKGLALNFQLKNRNLGKKAIQLENTLRTGIEFTNFKQILSSEISLSNRLVFPWLITPFKIRNNSNLINPRTYINLDGAYIDRFNYYKINSFNAFMGYEWLSKNNTSWQIRFPNIEITRLYDINSGFEVLLRDYPLLRYSYNNGLIIGASTTYSKRLNSRNPANANIIRIYGEWSGLLIGAVFSGLTAKNKPLDQLYRYAKTSVDFRHYVTRKKSSWVYRLFAGYGFAFDTKSTGANISLPFFKQFFAGGPNSMRGWQLRKLGPGSSIFYDTLRLRTVNPNPPPATIEKKYDDRYADLQLEGNIEYRFDLFPLYGYWLRAALFTDMGNIWLRKATQNTSLKYGEFNVSRLYQDIALDGGTGLRLDFKFFLLRFDLAWRLKDPLYASDSYNKSQNAGWFIKQNMNSPTFQFGIGYPF